VLAAVIHREPHGEDAARLDDAAAASLRRRVLE
jgi:hypothetical protein